MGNQASNAYCRQCGHRRREHDKKCVVCHGESFVSLDLLLEDMMMVLRQLAKEKEE